MNLNRVHLFEFEDFNWFPDKIRVYMTRYIIAVHKVMGTSAIISEKLSPLLKKYNQNKIVDLCSGSGGPMVEVINTLKNEYDLQNIDLTLTDLYPDQSNINYFNSIEDINYENNPVDATNVSDDLEGIRTLICGFHHMPPEGALQILKNAQEQKKPFFIFEISDNSIPLIVALLAFPIGLIMVLFLTPLIKPMTWQQIVLTYLIPILPFFIAWDGTVSNIRTYTENDFNKLISEIPDPDYNWSFESVKAKGGNKIAIIGEPLNL